MQKYYTTAIRDTDYPLSAAVYLASEVDARIAELEAALRELVEQADDYFYGDSGFPFKDAVDRAKSVL